MLEKPAAPEADAWLWIVDLLADALDRVPAPDRPAVIDALLAADGSETQQRLARDLAASADTNLDLYLPMLFA